MFRALRLLLVPALMLVVAAAAWAGPACDSEKASTDQATVAPASSGCAAKAATSAQAGVCAGKTASASVAECSKAAAECSQASHQADCVYCAFCDQLKASKESVTVTTVPTEHGVRLVFAGVTSDDVEAAQAVAAKAYAMMNAPAHCSVSRTKMASESCEGCKAGLAAFANANVTLEDTDTGAEAVISVKDDKQVDEVVAFFAHFQTADESNKG